MKIRDFDNTEPKHTEASTSFHRKIGNEKIEKRSPYGAATRDRSRGKRTLRDFRR